MVEILSTIRPKVEEKPEIKTDWWNDRTYQSYIKAGFPDNIPQSVRGPRNRMLKFLSAVDLRNGPIERTVRTMVRLRAPDYTTKKHERREWIYYEETVTGRNWLNVPINPISDHIVGRFTEILTKPVFDERTGVHVDNAWGGTREVYYIPFSKKMVDEIIAASAHSDKSGIRFVVKFAAEDSTDSILLQSMRNQFSYDMFVWDWSKLYEFQTWPVDDIVTRPKPNKSATKLEFKPS